MPIHAEDRGRYPKDWKAISRAIREREGNRCKFCKAPNHAVVIRGNDETYMLDDGRVFSAQTGEQLGYGKDYAGVRAVRIVLTVAHLNQRPEDNRPDNLAALCQRCHLRHDRVQHVQSRARRRRQRFAARDLFEAKP